MCSFGNFSTNGSAKLTPELFGLSIKGFEMKIWEQPHTNFEGREKELTVIIPIGLIEGHGSHLVSGADILIPLAIAESIDERVENCIIMYPIPYGVGDKNKKRFMLTIRPETFENMLDDTISSLVGHGFKKIFIINGHYDNYPSIEKVVSSKRCSDKDLRFLYLNWWSVLSEKTQRLFGEESDYAHAGQLETSVLLGINPDFVNFESENFSMPEIKENKDFPCMQKCSEYTCYANIERASASKGKITIEDAVEQMIEAMKKVFQ